MQLKISIFRWLDGFLAPIKQKGNFLEHFFPAPYLCTTFSTNIFDFNGLVWVQPGCRTGCSDGAPVVQVREGGFCCTLEKMSNDSRVGRGCKGADKEDGFPKNVFSGKIVPDNQKLIPFFWNKLVEELFQGRSFRQKKFPKG